MLPESAQNYFPVVDGQDRLIGIFSTNDVRSYLYDESLWKLAVARDIMTTNIICVVPDDDLNTALERFTELNLDELPVVQGNDSSTLLGILRRKDAIGVYNRRLLERKQQSQEHA
ncbi:MAG: chloride channel [Schlesneria sp.]|nr:chloride channel [Schlesneria sp.]